MIKLTNRQLEDIYDEEEYEKYELVDNDKWMVGHKCETMTFRFKEKETGKIYGGYIERHGNPFAGYEYSSEYFNRTEECPEVEQKEVTITKWVVKENQGVY